MKRTLLVTVLLCLLVSLVGCSQTATNDNTRSSSGDCVVMTKTISQAKMQKIESEWGADDILYKGKNTLVYLIQTAAPNEAGIGPDTLYVYKLKTTDTIAVSTTTASKGTNTVQCTGTTKAGNRCLAKTSDPSGYCYHHKK